MNNRVDAFLDRTSRSRSLRKRYRQYFFILGLLIIGALGIVIAGSIAPGNFPVGTTVTIKDGMTVSQAGDLLVEEGIVKSSFLYKVYVALLHGGHGVQAGEYLFSDPQSVLRVAYRTAYGIEDVPEIRVTLPEGIASYDIARLLAKDIPGFDTKTFLTLALPHEGYLFPDTYFFYPDTTPQQAVNAMLTDFDQRTRGLDIPIAVFGRSFSDVITMASIVGKEATSSADRRIIAGILWKRLDADMPLQVDPPFFYIFGKDSDQLTVADLATSSPYNLYKHTGLTPTPIDNPGVDAITDTINPVKTQYWYYLSDENGVMHYSVTFGGQSANKAKYME